MSGEATNAPAPSKFVFLHEIPSLSAGTKVRLLSCIVEYEISKGQLLLEHAYPKHICPVPRIWVDISLVLEAIMPETIAPGTWVNVIGYAQGPPRVARKTSTSCSLTAGATASLQAILIWNAGAIRIGDYEHTLEEQRRVERQKVEQK